MATAVQKRLRVEYEKGVSLTEAARIVGVSREYARQVCDPTGVLLRTQRANHKASIEWGKEQAKAERHRLLWKKYQAFIVDWEAELTGEQLAKKYNYKSRGCVYAVVNRLAALGFIKHRNKDFGTAWNKRMDEIGAERATLEDLKNI